MDANARAIATDAVEGIERSGSASLVHRISIAVAIVVAACTLGYAGWTGAEIVLFNHQINRYADEAVSTALNAASADPANPANAELVRSSLSAALEEKIPLQPRLIEETGDKFIEAAAANDDSWKTALQLIGYRSTLDVSGETLPRESCFPSPADPRIVRMVESLSVRDCTQDLDHVHWKDVVFRDVTVVYRGGAMELENVQFVNCHFKLDYGARSRALGQALLAADRVTIKLPS